MTISTRTPRVLVCQLWEESERGWGVRPDGCSLHESEEDLRAYVRMYWAGMPDDAPDEYARTRGEPFLAIVSEELYSKAQNAKAHRGIGLRESAYRSACASGKLRPATHTDILHMSQQPLGGNNR